VTTVKDIEKAVERLSPQKLAEFRAWYAKFDGACWDAQIKADAAAGRLDALADEALRDLAGNRCTKL
jgi:hypothetical protein